MGFQVLINHSDISSNLKRIFEHLVVDPLHDIVFSPAGNFPRIVDQPTRQYFNATFPWVDVISFEDFFYHLSLAHKGLNIGLIVVTWNMSRSMRKKKIRERKKTACFYPEKNEAR